ncbi:MAG TPA: response regulator transcription factor [Candidatus Kapabacteria bacterium]|nr:response regulator transcription factor [Candidatus Kapabacteria bacterium]
MSHTILIVDDHPIMRLGYASLIGRELDLEISGEAGSALEALAIIADRQPDLAIVDISLGGTNGIELIKHIRSLYPDVLSLVVSMHDETLYADRALAAGARGYIMKNQVDRTVIEAIRRILAGGYFFSDDMNTKFFTQLGSGQRLATAPLSPTDRLSDRELEVYEMLGHGRTVYEIARSLSISPKTVETHRARIKEKLGIASGRELLRHAIQWVEREMCPLGPNTKP